MGNKHLGELVEEMVLLLIENPDIKNPENLNLTQQQKAYRKYLKIKEELDKYKIDMEEYV